MRWLAVTFASALLIAACGDDDADPSPTTTATSTPTSTAPPTGTPTETSTPEPTPTVSATPGVTSVAGRTLTRFFSDEFDVSFEYERSPDEFVLEEFRAPEPGLPVAWSLVRRRELDDTPQNAFGPRGITVEVFDVDTPPESAEAWARGTTRSNFDFASGGLTARSVGGVTGVEYAWSGLHEARSVVVFAADRVWMFTATYQDDFEEIEGAFDAFLDSVSFGN
jgi:hypothetical protein